MPENKISWSGNTNKAKPQIKWGQEIPTSHSNILKVVRQKVGNWSGSLYKQTDSNQCGICAALNLTQILNRGLQADNDINEIRTELFNKRTYTNGDNSSNFWLTIVEIKEILSKKIGSSRFFDIFSSKSEDSAQSSIDSYVPLNQYFEGFILIQNSHWFAIALVDGDWFKIDSMGLRITPIDEEQIKLLVKNIPQGHNIASMGCAIKKIWS